MSLEPFVIHSSHFKNISYTEYIKLNENSKLDRNYINELESTFKNNYSLESGGCIAADGKSIVTFTAKHTALAFINNSANWEGGCLHSGSPQVATTQWFFFGQTPIFNGNYIRNLSQPRNYQNCINVGQGNIYGWPYTMNHMNRQPQQH